MRPRKLYRSRTLDEVASELNVSRQTVSNIEKAALAKFKTGMEQAGFSKAVVTDLLSPEPPVRTDSDW